MREDLLIELPLWIGALILTGRFTAAPFVIYRSKPFTKSLTLSRPQVKLSAILVNNHGARVTYFEMKNYGNAVAVNISFEIRMPLSQDLIRFDISSLGPDESLRFLPHMFRDGKRWGMNEQFPIEEFMKRAAFAANISRSVDAAVATVEQARMSATPAVPPEAMSVADPPRREPMIVLFDLHYLDFARTTRFRTPHVLTSDPSLPIVWDSLESFIRIDLSSEPESEPSTVMVAPASGVPSSASLRSG